MGNVFYYIPHPMSSTKIKKLEKSLYVIEKQIKQREEQERAWVEAQEANRRYVDEVLAKGNINGVVISKYGAYRDWETDRKSVV